MALKRLNENEQSRLDGQLQSLLQSLVQKPPKPDGTIIGEARGIIASQVGKLVRPSWEETWEYPDWVGGPYVATAWFEPKRQTTEQNQVVFTQQDQQESKRLHAVFTQMVAYVKATDPDDRQDAATNLKKALRRYLRLRGYNVEPSAAAPSPPVSTAPDQSAAPATAAVGEATTATRTDGPGGAPPTPPADQYVTLDQMASLVNRSKRTLERLKKRRNDPLPSPAVEGGGGKPDEWLWSQVRPWLEREYSRHLPERFPAR